MKIPPTAWSPLIVAVAAPVLRRFLQMGPLYPRVPISSDDEAVHKQSPVESDDREFHASSLAYLPTVCLLFAALGITGFGIFEWTRSQHWAWVFILAGGIILLSASNAINTLATSRIILKGSVIEYVLRRQRASVDLSEIEDVQVKATLWQGFISVVTCNHEEIRIPLCFRDPSRLLALLRDRSQRPRNKTAATGVGLYTVVGRNELDLIIHAGHQKLPLREYWQSPLFLVSSLNYAITNVGAWRSRDDEIGSVAYIIKVPINSEHLEKLPSRRLPPDVLEYEIPNEDVDVINQHVAGRIECLRECRGAAP